MIDIRVIDIEDVLQIVSVNYLQLSNASLPLSLDIIGKDFNRATKVEINNQPSPSFMILSPTRIIAQIPTNQVRSQITKVLVLATTPTPGTSSALLFTLGSTFKSVTGIERLVQLFVKILMQTPGSDRFRPAVGGGLRRIIGTNVDAGSTHSLDSSVIQSVTATRDQVIQLQNRNQRIPADERLQSASVISAGFSPQQTAYALGVSIAAVSGRQAVANLTF